jgi:catalase-peroxidase
MLTTDLSLRFDPAYEKISRRFYEHPDQFADAFARAWFKLTHRDMGRSRATSARSCRRNADLAGPDPGGEPSADRRRGHRGAEGEDPRSGLIGAQLVSTAWASASTFRGSDKRGGANGARIRLAPQKDWEVNEPAQLKTVLPKLEAIQTVGSGKQVSLADLIVLGGSAAVEKAAKDAGVDVKVPFAPGRMDASQEQTDVESFAPLEPRADGFRNYTSGKRQFMAPEEALVDRAQLLESHGTGNDGAGWRLARARRECRRLQARRLHERAGTLTNDFFVNLLTMDTIWQPAGDNLYEGRDRKTNALKWTGTRVDLIFGSHSQLRAFAEVYACADSKEKFVRDFVAAWTKVMNADRFDLS